MVTINVIEKLVIQIPLKTGIFALVDEEDYGIVSGIKWYAATSRTRQDGKYRVIGRLFAPRKNIYMHRLIMNAPKGMEVDHINGDPLDNRRINLRICTRSQNAKNIIKHIENGSSKYKGVSFDFVNRKWKSRIQCNRKEIWIGRFDSEIEAAKAYDRAAKELYGEFACPNFQKEIQTCR
jgi:hypothetical protein